MHSSVGGGGVSTLIACELLSDVHELCAKRIDGDELARLRKYLAQDRGWRCLATLHLLGVRGLSCGREFVALLIALYPVVLQEEANRDNNKDNTVSSAAILPARNPYVKFYPNDEDTVDTIDIVSHVKRKTSRSGRGGIFHEGNAPSSRSRKAASRRYSGMATKSLLSSARHKQKSLSCGVSYELPRRDTAESCGSSESEFVTDGVDQSRSLTLKIRLNPMDFEYFTSVVRSDEEQKWETPLYELPTRPAKKTPKDYVDERIESVLDSRISNFETSLLIIQLLQGLRDHDTPAEQTPAVQVLKFALDTLWSLQFGIDGGGLTGTECATLKASAARLMLTALERVLRANEPTTAVIHNGLLPMTLRLLEDACSKPVNVVSPGEGSLLQEFIFATIYGVITFLYCLLHQQGATTEKLSDFLELFQLFTESQDGRLVERAIFAILDLPSVDPSRSVTRARKIIDMIGALTSSLKSVRRDISHVANCNKGKHKSCINNVQIYHHSDIFGASYSQPIVGTVMKQACCISSLFMILTNLLKHSHPLITELQVRLIKVFTAAGTCCCFPPSILMISIAALLKKRDPPTYVTAVAFLERILFKELGGYAETEVCAICDRPSTYSWNFLAMYADLLTPDDPKLCHTVMAHLLKIGPCSKFHIRRELLIKVFYPIFLRAKTYYTADRENTIAKFLVQSSLCAMSCLMVNAQMCEAFNEINGLEEALILLSDATFTRNVYALLEITVIVEIWKTNFSKSDSFDNTEKFAVRSLFNSLETETIQLLSIFTNSMDTLVDGKQTRSNVRDIEETNIVVAEESSTFQEQQVVERKSSDTISWVAKVFDSAEIGTACQDQRIGAIKKMNLYQASVAWRAAAGVALCSPKFRAQLSSHSVSQKSLQLFIMLAVHISTDSITGTFIITID